MTRVAAVDCGTNSVRLLIADVEGGELTELDRRMEIVRLGEGVDRTGRLAPGALERTFGALRGFAKLIAERGGNGPIPTRMVATSATRDAANRELFVRGVIDILGVEPEVISGHEEARLSFAGATKDLDASRPCLVVDIGGGSTEFVLGAEAVEAARSVDIGCVRLTERHLRSNPPTPEQVAAAVADIDAALAQVRAEPVPVGRARTLVGLAGSVTTVAGIALGLPAYDPVTIHLSRIKSRQVHDVTRMLLRSTREERGRIGVMHPGRIDVIGAGALILDRVLREYAFADVVVSEHDLLDGLAWSLA